MSASVFAQTILNKLTSAIGTKGSAYTENSATLAMVAIAEGITEYLIANTTITIAYVGIMIPYPNPSDPVTTDTFKITGSCAPTGPSNSFDSWISKIEANIIAGFSLASMGVSGVAFPQKPFANTGILTTQIDLYNLHNVEDQSPHNKIWEKICQGIMDWINTTAINISPGPAKRASGPSEGTATITKITIT